MALRALVLQQPRRGGTSEGGPNLPYKKVPSIFTPAERQFYELLSRIVGQRYVIFAKVRMSDLLRIDAQGSERQSAWGRISQKHSDFVLLTRDTLAPVLVIELDDASHQGARRQSSDALKDAAYARAGLPILHVPVAREWNAAELVQAIQRALGVT